MTNLQNYIQAHQRFQANAEQTLDQIAQLNDMKPIVDVVKQVMDITQLFDVSIDGTNKLEVQFKTNYMPEDDDEYMDNYIKYVLIIDIMHEGYNVEIYSTPSDDQFHMEHYYIHRYHTQPSATSQTFMNNVIHVRNKVMKLIDDYRTTTYFNRDVYDVLEPVTENGQVGNDVLDNEELVDYLHELGGQIYVDKWNDMLYKYYLVNRNDQNGNYIYHMFIHDDTYPGPLSNQAVYNQVFSK